MGVEFADIHKYILFIYEGYLLLRVLLFFILLLIKTCICGEKENRYFTAIVF